MDRQRQGVGDPHQGDEDRQGQQDVDDAEHHVDPLGGRLHVAGPVLHRRPPERRRRPLHRRLPGRHGHTGPERDEHEPVGVLRGVRRPGRPGQEVVAGDVPGRVHGPDGEVAAGAVGKGHPDGAADVPALVGGHLGGHGELPVADPVQRPGGDVEAEYVPEGGDVGHAHPFGAPADEGDALAEPGGLGHLGQAGHGGGQLGAEAAAAERRRRDREVGGVGPVDRAGHLRPQRRGEDGEHDDDPDADEEGGGAAGGAPGVAAGVLPGHGAGDAPEPGRRPAEHRHGRPGHHRPEDDEAGQGEDGAEPGPPDPAAADDPGHDDGRAEGGDDGADHRPGPGAAAVVDGHLPQRRQGLDPRRPHGRGGAGDHRGGHAGDEGHHQAGGAHGQARRRQGEAEAVEEALEEPGQADPAGQAGQRGDDADGQGLDDDRADDLAAAGPEGAQQRRLPGALGREDREPRSPCSAELIRAVALQKRRGLRPGETAARRAERLQRVVRLERSDSLQLAGGRVDRRARTLGDRVDGQE